MTTTTQTIAPETTAQLADLFDAHGISSPFASASPMVRMYGPADTSYLAAHAVAPAIVELVAELPDAWKTAVHDELGRRRAAAARAERAVAIQELETTDAVRAFLLERVDGRGVNRAPELKDLRSWVKSAQGHITATGCAVAPYRPEAGCQAKLKLERAVYFAYRQESYADHTEYAVPVELAADADLAVCRRNLAAFCAALRTATGWAGQGSTYDAALVVTEQGALVHFDVRHSIAD